MPTLIRLLGENAPRTDEGTMVGAKHAAAAPMPVRARNFRRVTFDLIASLLLLIVVPRRELVVCVKYECLSACFGRVPIFSPLYYVKRRLQLHRGLLDPRVLHR